MKRKMERDMIFGIFRDATRTVTVREGGKTEIHIDMTKV